MELLCSIGAFTRSSDPRNWRAILTYGPQVDVEGLEVIFYPNWFAEADAIAAGLGVSGLRFPVMHAEKGIGPLLGTGRAADRAEAVRSLTANCALGAALGCRLLVLHLWGLPDSDAHIERNLGALPECLDVADGHGLALAVETIPCTHSDPLAVVARALERDARCLVALDTEFLAMHGQVEAALTADWLWEGQRVRHVHVKDYDGQMVAADGRRRFLHPGEGSIDFAGFFGALTARGFRGSVSLEASSVQRDGSVEIARTQRAIAALRAMLGQAAAR